MVKKPVRPRHPRDILLMTVITVGLLVVLFLGGSVFYRYTNAQIYNESVSQLNELSNQLIEKLEVQIDTQWEYLHKLTARLDGRENLTVEELQELFQKGQEDLCPEGKTLLFRAIDEEGSYYTVAGRQGMWTGLEKLNSEMDHQSFLIANWLDNENYMTFTERLEEPLYVDGVRITHLVALRPMEDMQPFFHSSAFSSNNMIYIIDQTGLILFEDGHLSGIDFKGTNLFHSLREQTFPHLSGGLDSFIQESAENERACTDVTVEGKSYYMLYDRLPEYDWGLLMLVSSADVASTTAAMVNSLVRVYVMILVLLALALLAASTFLSRFETNRRILSEREQNEAVLEQANSELEKTNAELEKAQKETQEALRMAQTATKAKSQFLANMSHDIRTPMNAIIGITKLMEGEIDDRAKLPYYLHKLQQSGSYMLGLINDILDMSKIESGEVTLNAETVRMAEQAGQIESIIRSQSNEKNQEFTVLLHEVRHEYLIGDSVRLRQVFINLLNNAVKYTQEGGKIRFEIRELPSEDPNRATILTSVIDNGYGMSQDFLKRIFEPFTRAENSLTNKVQGTGLGMSITKNLVDLMGGTITVESELNKGSRFDVLLSLPIDFEAERSAVVSSVMLVTDEEMLVTNVEASLSGKDIELRVAESPEKAIELLREKPSEALLLSGYLPDERLGDTVRALREAAKDAILIFCCDYAHREHVRQVLADSGVDGFIARPFFLENLKIAVDSAHRDQDETEEKRTALSGKKFLCAEDNELNAEILEALLDMHGATCKIYPNGQELVEAFAQVRPGDYDAILMDVQMPRMNGIQATKAIRSHKNRLGETIPIIAMTANAFSSDVQECLEAGMDAHLAKPVDITALERTLHEVTAKYAGGGTTVLHKKES